MPTHRWILLFVTLAAVQAAQTLLHREIVPYTGTLATAALLALAASRHDGRRGPGRRALAGLALLTLAALAVDHENDGYGWPLEFGGHGSPLPPILVVAGVLLLAVALLSRVGAVRKVLLIPAGLLAAGVVLLIAEQAGPDPAAIRWLLVPAVAVILVLFAVNAALAGGRRWRPAGWGLLPVLVLALGALGAFGTAEPVTGGVQVHAELHELRACTRLTYVAPIGVQPTATCERAGPAYYDNSERAASAVAVAVWPPAAAADPPPPISWDWQGDPDWSAVAAATAAAALLVGLAAFVRTLFPR
ncbi:hypothetical protein [Paractinoplanes rishiriensis]|uniref:hypothetical protein n=1 Tax=Paractinoplanes rishiriensis TaxID=1050105 RepID=UPI001943D73F|nr:hypothetical protein [Actinoplanes rishiriensis]